MRRWVEARDYKGYDPGDGLTSFLRPLTFGNIFAERLLQQFIWKSPINVRPFVGVVPLDSTKGRGFMAWGYLLLHQCFQHSVDADRERQCLDWLDQHREPGQAGHCWGNHFDFTTRSGRMTAHTPTIVWSGLIKRRRFGGLRATQRGKVSGHRREHLHVGARSPQGEDRQRQLLELLPVSRRARCTIPISSARALLARTWKHRKKEEYLAVAREAVLYSCSRQLPDGSWWYGEEEKYHWIDNFHTGYNLDSIKRFTDSTGDTTFRENLEAGYRYFKATFFEASGCPKYYHNRTFPVDIQCAAQAVEHLCAFRGTKIPRR